MSLCKECPTSRSRERRGPARVGQGWAGHIVSTLVTEAGLCAGFPGWIITSVSYRWFWTALESHKPTCGQKVHVLIAIGIVDAANLVAQFVPYLYSGKIGWCDDVHMHECSWMVVTAHAHLETYKNIWLHLKYIFWETRPAPEKTSTKLYSRPNSTAVFHESRSTSWLILTTDSFNDAGVLHVHLTIQRDDFEVSTIAKKTFGQRWQNRRKWWNAV